MTYSYDSRIALNLETQANGVKTSYVYDLALQPTQVAHLTAASAVTEKFKYKYKYDLADRKLRCIELSGDITTWSYDAAGQLTRERRSGANAYITTYQYDLAGNRTLLHDSSGRTTSLYDNANRLRYSQTVSGRTTYTFDNAGNQVSERTPIGNITTHTWDADSRLIRVELPTTDLVTYTWAPCTKLGEMRQIERDDGTDVTRLVWDNQNVVQETDELNVVQTEYTYQPLPQPYGHLVSDRASGASMFYRYDALQSTINQTNSGGTVTDDYRYKAFGPSLYHTGSSASPYTYVGDLGYRQDADTANTNVRERDYRRTTGRFLSTDPLGEAGGDFNFYRYVGNDPINRVDPSGLETRLDEPTLSEPGQTPLHVDLPGWAFLPSQGRPIRCTGEPPSKTCRPFSLDLHPALSSLKNSCQDGDGQFCVIPPAQPKPTSLQGDEHIRCR